MLLQQIKYDLDTARKEKPIDKSKVALLSTLYSEAKMIGKNDKNRETTDEEVIGIIGKFIKGANEMRKDLLKMNRDVSATLKEIQILNSYFPKQLTEEELNVIIIEIVNTFSEKSPKMMGQVMNQLKSKYNGQYDGKMASTLVKKALS